MQVSQSAFAAPRDQQTLAIGGNVADVLTGFDIGHDGSQRHPDDDWAKNAQIQIDRILLPQVRISQAGLQLPGEPAGLQLSYRNTGKIWFVAREIFHDGFLRYLRNQEVDKYKGLPHWWTLRNWHSPFAASRNKRSEIQNIAAKFVGPEVARWARTATPRPPCRPLCRSPGPTSSTPT